MTSDKNRRKYLARLERFKQDPEYRKEYLAKARQKQKELYKNPEYAQKVKDHLFNYRQRVKSGLTKPQNILYSMDPPFFVKTGEFPIDFS
jgi:hypothetical protein